MRNRSFRRVALVLGVAAFAALTSGVRVKRTDEISYRITSWVQTPAGLRVVHSDYRVRGSSRNNPTFGKGWSGLACSLVGSAARVPTRGNALYVLTTDEAHLGRPNEYHCDLLMKYLHFTNGAQVDGWQDEWSRAREERPVAQLDPADVPLLVEIEDPTDWRTIHPLDSASDAKIVHSTLSVIDEAAGDENVAKELPWLSTASEVRGELTQRVNFVSDWHNPLNN